MVGDYSKEPLSPAVQHNTIAALATLHAALGLDPNTLKLHREDPKTTHICPGSNVVKDHVIAQVVASLSEQAPGEHLGIPEPAAALAV